MNTQRRGSSPPRLRAQTTQHGHALLALLKTTWSEYERDYARYFAVAMVYYALVSLVPLLLLLLAALGLLLRLSDVAAYVEQQVLITIESNLGPPLRVMIEQLLQQLRQQSVAATVISLGGLVLTASVLFKHLRMSFRAIWKQAPPLASDSMWTAIAGIALEKLISFLLVLAGGALLVSVLVVIAGIHWLSRLISHLPILERFSGWLIALPGSLIVVPLTFALLFKVLPPVRPCWRDIWLASVLCAAAWLISVEVLTLYGVYLGNNLSAYGALGGILMIMLWMNVVAQVLFFGAELCKVVTRSREPGGHISGA